MSEKLSKNCDREFMAMALEQAKSAAAGGEVPVGAIIVHNGEVVSAAHNTRETRKCALDHAEIIAIKRANQKLNRWRLSGCTLFVTIEPCVMCAGALWQARIERVVFGAYDLKGGALGSLYGLHRDARLNHTFEVCSGVLASECSRLLSEFFRAKRSGSIGKESTATMLSCSNR